MDWTPLWTALGLVALAFALLVAEFFIVSFGALLVSAIAAVTAGIYFAFQVSDEVGWLFVVAVPVVTTFVVRWGVSRVRQSNVVPKAEVTAEAGYHHVADRLGVSVGARGTMVTAGRPSGRARFAGGECDVQSRGRPLERSAAVTVVAIDGPMIFVELDRAAAAQSPLEERS